MNDGSIERMPASAFQPLDVPYVDMFGLDSLYKGLAFRAPTIVVGPKGIGKTLSFQAFAAREKCPIITFDCSEDVRRSQLLGAPMLRGDTSPFVLGPIPTAIEVANEAGSCVLVFEEINSLNPQCQKILNAIADWRRAVVVPEARATFRLKSGAKLWICGSMNTANYSGVFDLNEDLKSRFRLIPLDYPPPEREKEAILATMTPGLKVEPKVLTGAMTLALESRQGSWDYALSTRDVVQFIEDASVLNLNDAARILLGKFEDTDRAAVRQRLISIFEGIKIAEIKTQKNAQAF